MSATEALCRTTLPTVSTTNPYSQCSYNRKVMLNFTLLFNATSVVSDKHLTTALDHMYYAACVFLFYHHSLLTSVGVVCSCVGVFNAAVLLQSLRSSVYTRSTWMSSMVVCRNQMRTRRKSMCFYVIVSSLLFSVRSLFSHWALTGICNSSSSFFCAGWLRKRPPSVTPMKTALWQSPNPSQTKMRRIQRTVNPKRMRGSLISVRTLV